MDAPRDNLFRGLARAPRIIDATRAADTDTGSSGVLTGHFAVFNQWTEIDSWYEGRFLETLAPGCFTKTMKERRGDIKVQFDHGYDYFVGGAPLGPIDVLEEDSTGARYEVPLLDTDYNRDRVEPMLAGRLLSGEERGSQLGASFRFRVIKDEWDDEPGVSDHNPEGLPERTIKEVRLFEFGPVVFPAYAGATAGLRSLTDHFLEQAKAARSTVKPPAGQTTGDDTDGEPTDGHSTIPSGRSLAAAVTIIETLRRVPQ